jgi:hypothetical protein
LDTNAGCAEAQAAAIARNPTAASTLLVITRPNFANTLEIVDVLIESAS